MQPLVLSGWFSKRVGGDLKQKLFSYKLTAGYFSDLPVVTLYAYAYINIYILYVMCMYINICIIYNREREIFIKT